MVFVDGENLACAARDLASGGFLPELREGPLYRRDTFVWALKRDPTTVLRAGHNLNLQRRAVRANFYTFVQGSWEEADSVSVQLHNLGFTPVVKAKGRGKKAKGVDIQLTTDLLVQAFLDNYDVAVVVTGDADFIPVIEEVKRLGKQVIVAFFADTPRLNPKLRAQSDTFLDLTGIFIEGWEEYNARDDNPALYEVLDDMEASKLKKTLTAMAGGQEQPDELH